MVGDKVIHVLSKYASSHKAEGNPFKIGHNSFQIHCQEERFTIISIFWDRNENLKK